LAQLRAYPDGSQVRSGRRAADHQSAAAATTGSNTTCLAHLLAYPGLGRFDLGFEPQITKVLENTRPDRQTVFFSATFPKQMESLAKKHLRHPIEMVVGGRSVVR